LPLDKKIVLYAGHLYERKGAFVVGEAAPLLDDDTLVLFVGGTEDEIPDFTNRYGSDSHVRILGPKPHADIPYYLCAADVLVLPNSAKDADARLYTSPMKLFEYMASGTPIIASDVPSVREILNEQTAYFFAPDDPRALAESVLRVLLHKEEADEKVCSAKKIVAVHTWEKRAKNIMNALIAVTNTPK
jgi:glycosyltransferase involved in cell wall biosynthesis